MRIGQAEVSPRLVFAHGNGDLDFCKHLTTSEGATRQHLQRLLLRHTPWRVMEYETADGSQFSLRIVETHNTSDQSVQTYVSISAFVDGKAYFGRTEKDIELLEDEEVLNCLQPLPPECIHPPVPQNHPIASSPRPNEHYLKAPSFTFDDCQPGNTFVADCFLNEAIVLGNLNQHPHPNLAKYHGAVVVDGRITQLCLQKYDYSLTHYVKQRGRLLSWKERKMLLDHIKSGIKHLHKLGLAHNDINPDNICVDSDGRAIVVDFDSCLPFEQRLLKGFVARKAREGEGLPPLSDPENDWYGLDHIAEMLVGSNEQVSDA